MANYNVTPNMQLPNPVPGGDPGPDYANNLQSSLNIVDQHNHSAGQGVLIQPSGLNISSDLTFNGNNATALRSIRFLSQSAPISNSGVDKGILYVSGNELWYNDYTGGNQVQITTNGLINATSSGISSGSATAAFSAGALIVKSSSTSFANIDVQSVVLANAGNLTNQLTLLAPTLSSSFDLTLPAVPVSLAFVTLDTSGNFGTNTATFPFTTTSIAPKAIAQGNLALRSTGSTVGIGGVAVSSSSLGFNTTSTGFVSVTNLSVTISTTGRPVQVYMMANPNSASSTVSINSTVASEAVAAVQILNATTSVSFAYEIKIQAQAVGGNIILETPSSSFVATDFPPDGTYTYVVQVASGLGAPTVSVNNAVLVAYEL